jgi:hypothetical protein
MVPEAGFISRDALPGMGSESPALRSSVYLVQPRSAEAGATSAMETGITSRVWTLADLLA